MGDGLVILYFRRLTKRQPILLVGEADGHQQRSETEKTENTISLAQVARVVKKGFADREDQQDQRLPADEGGTLPEADRQQACAIQHKECGDGERPLQIGLWTSVTVAPGGLKLPHAGEHRDKVERNDGSTGDLEPTGRGRILMSRGTKSNCGGSGKGRNSEQGSSEAAIQEGGVDPVVEPDGLNQQTAETQREGSDGKTAQDPVNTGRRRL